MAISPIFQTQVGSTACSPLDWRWLCLPSSVATRCSLPWGECTKRLLWATTSLKAILCCFSFGLMASCKAFCLLPQLFLLVSDQKSFKTLERTCKRWSGPSPCRETRPALQWLPHTCIFLKMPCACRAGACPLFHSPCIWKALINIWSKLILLPIISGPSKTHSGYFSFLLLLKTAFYLPETPLSQRSLV